MSLARAFSPDVLVAHIDQASDEEIERLLATVRVASSRNELKTLVRSPHFQQAMNQLTVMLSEGGTRGLAAEAGVDYNGEGVQAFLEAVRRQQRK